MRAARARACLALLSLSCASADMMMYCWRAAHFWTLNVQKAGTADWVHNDVTATVVGPALTASADGPLGTDSGSVFGGSSYVLLDAPMLFGGNFTVTASLPG